MYCGLEFKIWDTSLKILKRNVPFLSKAFRSHHLNLCGFLRDFYSRGYIYVCIFSLSVTPVQQCETSSSGVTEESHFYQPWVDLLNSMKIVETMHTSLQTQQNPFVSLGSLLAANACPSNVAFLDRCAPCNFLNWQPSNPTFYEAQLPVPASKHILNPFYTFWILLSKPFHHYPPLFPHITLWVRNWVICSFISQPCPSGNGSSNFLFSRLFSLRRNWQ